MHVSTLKTLIGLEYDALAIDARLGDLRARLLVCRFDAPEVVTAARQLSHLRRMLRSVLASLDDHVTEAVKAAEHLEPAPF